MVTCAFLAAGLLLQFFEPDGVRKGVPHSQPALLQVDSSECDYVRSEAAQIAWLQYRLDRLVAVGEFGWEA